MSLSFWKFEEELKSKGNQIEPHIDFWWLHPANRIHAVMYVNDCAGHWFFIQCEYEHEILEALQHLKKWKNKTWVILRRESSTEFVDKTSEYIK